MLRHENSYLLLLLARMPLSTRLCSSGVAPRNIALMVSGRSAVGSCTRCLSNASMAVRTRVALRDRLLLRARESV